MSFLLIRSLKELNTASTKMIEFMKEQARSRKQDLQAGEAKMLDLFSLLIKSNEAELEKYALDDSEVVRCTVATSGAC